jgi:hypothetical protein
MIMTMVNISPDQLRQPRLPRQTLANLTAYFSQSDTSFSERFRFKNAGQIKQLLDCFRFPTDIISIDGYKFTAEEIVCISLIKLSWPQRWCQIIDIFPGRKRWELVRAFYWFIEFMVANWGYLLLNNMEYWKPSIPTFAEALRVKLATLPNENFRQQLPPANEAEGFCVFCFIDNTMNAFCRPGGVIDEGEQARRVPREVQQAWWTGWKKLHGMKWQTLDLPNGMNFHVWGAASVRHNDLYTLQQSNIEEKLMVLQEDQPLKYKIYGDSAYHPSEVLVVGNGRGMSSLRETIEWDYKDLKEQWKHCNWKIVLNLRKQPIAKIVFVCLLLRNAYTTMNGCQTSLYFLLVPPTLEEWTSQGPRAHPIPDNITFIDDEN